jgi:hypothetical protein
MNGNQWARLLAYVTGLVNQELLLQNEYLAAENRILRTHLPARLRLSDPERCTLAEIGKRLGRKALEKVACVAKPDTILGWYRRLVARKFDGSKRRVSSRILPSCACNPGSESSTFFRPPPVSRICPLPAPASFFLLFNSATALVIVVRDIPVNSDKRLTPPRP